jgi:hypothetical protein
MVDNTTWFLGMARETSDKVVLNLAGLSHLTPAQRAEVRRYLASKIEESDELLGAVARKIHEVSKRGSSDEESAPESDE